MTKIALFGGAFDPIHHGHLAVAKQALTALGLDQVRLLPCARPVHKASCQATPWQRAAMIALAINGQAGLVLDTAELERDTPSYAIDTIETFIKDHSPQQLAWILGADALLDFKKWHRWQDILARVDLVVVDRPGTDCLALEPLWAELSELAGLKGHALQRLSIAPQSEASRHIRRTLAFNDVPYAVRRYIEAEGIYTPYDLF